jgi:hypothetical protein
MRPDPKTWPAGWGWPDRARVPHYFPHPHPGGPRERRRGNQTRKERTRQ